MEDHRRLFSVKGCGHEVEACSCASEWRSSISTSASIRRKSDRSHLEDYTNIFLNVFGVPERVSVSMFLTHLASAWTLVHWDVGKMNNGSYDGWRAQGVAAPAPARAVPPQKEDCGVATQPNAADMPHGSRHSRNSARSLQMRGITRSQLPIFMRKCGGNGHE